MISLVARKSNPIEKHSGVARISYESMDKIGATTNDVIEILGKHRTVARCKPHFAWEKHKETIRINGIVQANAGVKMGDNLQIQKAEPIDAIKINVVPTNNVPRDSEQYLHDFMEGHAIATRDKISLPFFDTTLDYRVRKIIPNVEYAIVARETVFHVDVVL